MTKIIENINASELPITEIDREAAAVAYYDGVEPPTTTIHIQVGDEEIHVNSFKTSVSLNGGAAEDIWKAYYLPVHYQINALREIVSEIAKVTDKYQLLKDTPIVVSYYATNDTFFIEYLGKEFVVMGDKDKIILKSEVVIPLLESPVFKTLDPTNVYHHYHITREMVDLIRQLLAGYCVTNHLLSIMNLFEDRQKFFERYNQLHNKEN